MHKKNQLEEACLKYILVAVEARDFSAPIRTFVDNWFAYKEGGPFLNGNSRPIWFNNPCPNKQGGALGRAHFISSAAARTLGGLERKRLVKDHAIPVSVLRDMLFVQQRRCIDDVRAFLLRHVVFGIISYDEDERLNRAGLRSRMPTGWVADRDSSFARYEEVGIVAQDRGSISAASEAKLNVPKTKQQIPLISTLLASTTGALRFAERGRKAQERPH